MKLEDMFKKLKELEKEKHYLESRIAYMKKDLELVEADIKGWTKNIDEKIGVDRRLLKSKTCKNGEMFVYIWGTNRR